MIRCFPLTSDASDLTSPDASFCRLGGGDCGRLFCSPSVCISPSRRKATGTHHPADPSSRRLSPTLPSPNPSQITPPTITQSPPTSCQGPAGRPLPAPATRRKKTSKVGQTGNPPSHRSASYQEGADILPPKSTLDHPPKKRKHREEEASVLPLLHIFLGNLLNPYNFLIQLPVLLFTLRPVITTI